MKLFKSLGLLALATFSYADSINFRVICIGCTEVQVVINGNTVFLNKYQEKNGDKMEEMPYFMGPVEAKVNDR